jgi:hypothetical protein
MAAPPVRSPSTLKPVNSLQSIQKPQLDRIVALALVDTAKSAQSKAASLIAKRTGLKVGTVKPRIFYDHVAPGDYEVAVRSSRKAIPLIEFPTRQVATGVSTRAWGKQQIIQHAFIATMKSGHTGVFRRHTKSRLPIEELWGPTIYGTFKTKEVQAVISDTMKARLQTSLARHMASAAAGTERRPRPRAKRPPTAARFVISIRKESLAPLK